MYTVCGTCKVMYVRELYRSVQRMCNNADYVTVPPLGCCIAMRIFGIIHLQYGAQRDPIICEHSLIKPYTYVCQGAVKIHITGT